MAVKAIRVPEGVIRLAEVNHLVLLGNKGWCKRSSKVVARRATAMMMEIRLWREPDIKHMIMHLHQDWDLGHWIRMISVSSWIGFTSLRGWKSKAHQVLRALGLES